MVSILPAERTPFDVFGRQFRESVSAPLQRGVEQGLNRGQLQQNLKQVRELSKNEETSPIELILSALEAGAGIPGSERYLSALLPILEKTAMANASQKAPIAGEPARNREPLEPIPQRQQQPTFLNQPQQQAAQFFPSNVGPQGGPGNVPQAATTGIKRKLRTREEKIPAARQLAKEMTDANIPTTVPQAMELINEEEAENKAYNDQIDKELGQRVKGQQTYGNRAVDELKKVYPKATPELETIFQKKGEEASTKGWSEAEINRYLANEAKKFSNTISNIKNDLSAPRSYNSLLRGLRGTYKDFEQSANDLRVKMKPILDQGLYDTSRNILQDLGYAPEEREIIIHPLSETSKIMMNKVPQGHALKWTPEKQKENVKNGLRDLKKEDPNFSLVLARKAFEDKNYDWRIFKDSLNELQNEGFELEDDQQNQLTYLDTPPLEFLEKILHGIGIQGR